MCLPRTSTHGHKKQPSKCTGARMVAANSNGFNSATLQCLSIVEAASQPTTCYLKPWLGLQMRSECRCPSRVWVHIGNQSGGLCAEGVPCGPRSLQILGPCCRPSHQQRQAGQGCQGGNCGQASSLLCGRRRPRGCSGQKAQKESRSMMLETRWSGTVCGPSSHFSR